MTKQIPFKSKSPAKSGDKATLPPAKSAGELFAQSDIVLQEVEVPEWGVTVFIRLLPADEGLDLNNKMQALAKENAFEAIFMLLGATLSTPDGDRIIKTEEDMAKLRTRSAKVLLRLQKVALDHQGWNEEAPKGSDVSNATGLVASPTVSQRS